ncbi:hypothetical protein G6F57_010554 [Rhizopus arrhizus]|nr:hypothetical protein G6F30_009165 [Rhizopus arrhizus]KAG0977154.1 hypothetical protein G6F29_010283 [Rhizopus arrhizus]KAG0992063.1 hypothetical protein G6F28_008002 [Rhizopus arrhizus]KAG1004192.1 hypothetical protein G6F27_010364 [Rhizopus arrhizus]KAG1029099.1 hypothetical protein G6F26_002029 [Rhizopus arrhizus]
MSISCSIGLLPNKPPTDVGSLIEKADLDGHDFVVVPIANSSFRRVLNENNEMSPEEHAVWKDRPVFDRKDLILNSAEWSGKVLGLFSDWIQLDSPNHTIRTCSELALKQEAEWASHINLTGILFPVLDKQVHNTARVINSISTMNSPQICIRVPLLQKGAVEDNMTWKTWNKFRSLLGHTNTKVGIALELTSELPSDERLLDMWLAEPVRTLIIPAHVFVSNAKGHPVLTKPHQNFVKKLIHKLEPDIILHSPSVELYPSATDASFSQYIQYLYRHLPEPDEIEKFASGYFDSLQMPLQPLADNLENQTYEIFEKDPIKYQQYERAVYQALLDRVEYQSDRVTTIMVVGAGRGPLVNCCLRAAEHSLRRVHIIALEKNPNAYVTLQNAKANVWGDKVTLVFADMRKWKPKEKCDILVSELLGSFGDNELSPECLDGAQKFLKEDGISIPTSYTASIAPLASSRLYNNVNAYKSLSSFETPYVVMFRQVCPLADPEDLWTFEHPNKKDIPADENPVNNMHNERYSRADFIIQHDMIMHGIAGYFDCSLYKDITISINPETHSPGMFSWFPIFFPVHQPIQITKESMVSIHFWRLTDQQKVWYEWSVTVNDKEGEETYVSGLHNPGGRSYYVGL